ncbi:MAG: hydrogenase maturation protein [Saprospiraceae bacterium]|nr:MAG: hydrogenase maturation protein [Saprospiraceae bacterium]
MKILFLTTAFNGLAQRAWLELDRLNHQVRVQIATDAVVMENAVEEFQPELIIAPFLKKKIPENIWKNHVCLVIHPGIKGDRGASSLDWAILKEEKEWGVTLLQATEKMDAGAIWASRTFPMRKVPKACLYRHEVTQAAMESLLEAVEKFEHKSFQPTPLDYANPDIKGTWNRSTRPSDYQFSWTDAAADILKKIRAADSEPGVLIQLFDEEYYAFGGHLEERLTGNAGQILAKRNQAICIATADNAIWLTHLKANQEGAIKLPATLALGQDADVIPSDERSPFDQKSGATFQEIRYEQEGEVGFIYFDFYNGAMNVDQCNRLRETIIEAKKRPIKIIVLMGGEDVWSNGIHLNTIEYADNPADESWANINAIDDLILEIIQSPNHYMVAALQGNAGAGGVPFALAGDKVLARNGIVLNPHTKNMGLYGSEYWTYLLPKRIGTEKANHFTEQCLPWGTALAKEIGLIDDVFGATAADFRQEVKKVAHEIAGLSYFDKLLMAKRFQQKKDSRVKALAKYREEELVRMRVNFYENDENYDEKRYWFVHKIYDAEQGQSVEDRDWYSSRRKIYRRRKWESIDYDK